MGSSEDDTNFSTTDFNLGEEDTGGDFSENMGEAGQIAPTQVISQIDDLPELDDDEDDTNLRAEDDAETKLELPEDIGEELEFSMGDQAADEAPATDDANMDDIAMEFDLGEDEAAAIDDKSEVDFGAEFESAMEDADDLDLDDSEVIPFEPDFTDTTTGELIDDDAVEINVESEEEEGYTETAVITPNYEATEVVPQLDSSATDEEEEIGFGMEDTAMIDLDETSLETGELNLDTGELELLGADEDDDDEDISIIDFGGEDFVEPTDIIETVEDPDDSIFADVDDDDVKTGTFAPGDFEEPTAAVASIADVDDIGDLMLPDDVDEVSTKLDLARAFIDMGDTEGARGSLEEVMSEGNEDQKTEAKALLDQI